MNKTVNTLCIVPCGKKKIWDKKPEIGSVKAKNMYIGMLSKKAREYAEKFYPKDWIVLSAKHGFLFPDDIVPEHYNACFHNSSSTISIGELKKQVKEKKLYKYDKIIVLGGKYYTELIKNIFTDKEVVNPLDGCRGIGYMMAKLNDEIKKE